MQIANTVILDDRRAERRGLLTSAHANDTGLDTPLEPGTRLDRYLILSQLGGVGMVLVYRAQDTELDREVALKVLAKPYCQQSEALNRFRNEAQAQARLRSPHVITLYSLLETPNAAVLVLEYSQGETLEQRLKSRGVLPADQAIGIFDQALRGLAHLHEMGVVHRDLKPSNLFITTGGQVKIMDFSVAKLPDHDVYPLGTMVGTLLYISPEQVRGQPVDARSDIYTLGVSLYEAVTGRLPFERHTDYALMHAHVQELPPRPSKLEPSLPPALERVILKAIEKEPERRYRSAAEFRLALAKLGLTHDRLIDTVLPANAYGPVPVLSKSHDSGRRVLAGFAVDLLLVAAACALLYLLGLYPGRSSPSPQTATAELAPANTPVTPQPARARSRLVAAVAPKPTPIRAERKATSSAHAATEQRIQRDENLRGK
ncbi:MAG: serine/threonine protein kinase [Gammaproteobacteria bacterium]|nr:serine/threonine protein kinase [Gammaproteobacteria bacterium]